MNGKANKSLNDRAAAANEHAQPRAESCFHCGDACLNASFASGGKTFCCQGCLIVHDLLAESGMAHFYDLSRHPGVRSTGKAKRERWAFLDEPALQQQLLDFTDGKLGRVTFRIPTIHCIACVWLLENLFRLHPGVGSSRVNFPKRETAIDFDPRKISLSELAALLASIGYEPALTLNELEKRKPNSLSKRQWIQIGVAGFAFGNVMLFSLPAYFGLDAFSGPVFHQVFNYLSLAFALPVLVFCAEDYWKSALLSLRHRTLTLDVPITMGLIALYAQSIVEMFAGQKVGYLDSLVGLVFFLLCGRAFQQKTHERLAFDRDYKSFFPLSATRKTNDAKTGAEQSVSLSQLAVGDHILIRNGELIPADSKLVSGDALVDYSFVTGESAPVAKAAGEHLYAGGKQTGALIELEIVKPVSQSYLTSLWNHEAFQKNQDESLTTLTNRYSRWFTLIVIAVALGAAFFWICAGQPARAAKAFTSVLIVACPCALALAAPFTLGTAQRVLARVGVFVRNAFVLERMAHVTSIAFDKTGTLTAPNSAEVTFEGEPLNSEEERWIYSLARHSTHPLSARLTAFLGNKFAAVKVNSFREVAGRGVSAGIGGREIKLGSADWIQPSGADSNGQAFTSEPKSNVYVSIDGKMRGRFAFANSLRADTDRLFAKLSSAYKLALLSGDNEVDRATFRVLLGKDSSLHFQQSPVDKLNFIKDLRESGDTVMMVGDGLNDAGALKQSDVGVAVVEKIGTFSPASDVILQARKIPRLEEILEFARASTRILRVGLAISAAYNIAGVSVAAAGVLSPLLCAILMPLSSISVILFACGMTAWAGRKVGCEERSSTNNLKQSASVEFRADLLSPMAVQQPAISQP